VSTPGAKSYVYMQARSKRLVGDKFRRDMQKAQAKQGKTSPDAAGGGEGDSDIL
jgi:hypothetical protein